MRGDAPLRRPQSLWASGQQQMPTSREIGLRRWKLAYRQNQHPLPQTSPTVRTVNAGQRCPGQTLPPDIGLRRARPFAGSRCIGVPTFIFGPPFSCSNRAVEAARNPAARFIFRPLRETA